MAHPELLRDYEWLTFVGFTPAFAQMGLRLLVPWMIRPTIDEPLDGDQTRLLVT